MVTAEISTATKATDSATKATSRKSASLPQETVDYLKAWMMSPEHISNPHPKEQLQQQYYVPNYDTDDLHAADAHRRKYPSVN